MLDAVAGSCDDAQVELARAGHAVLVPELDAACAAEQRSIGAARWQCAGGGVVHLVGWLQLVGKQATAGVRLVSTGPDIDTGIEEGAARRPAREVEAAVYTRLHLGPGAAVISVVASRRWVVRDRVCQISGVRQRGSGDDRRSLGIADLARRRIRRHAARVVAVVGRSVAVGTGRSVAVPRFPQVSVDAGGPVGVGVADDRQRRGVWER